MPDNSVKLTDGYIWRLRPCCAYTGAIILIVVNTRLTVYSWIALLFLGILAVNYWIQFFWPSPLFEISNRGIWYQENDAALISWEDLEWFKTTTTHDSESGAVSNTLILKSRRRFLHIYINLDRLRTNETQIREWIKKYAAVLPVDEGHTTDQSPL